MSSDSSSIPASSADTEFPVSSADSDSGLFSFPSLLPSPSPYRQLVQQQQNQQNVDHPSPIDQPSPADSADFSSSPSPPPGPSDSDSALNDLNSLLSRLRFSSTSSSSLTSLVSELDSIYHRMAAVKVAGDGAVQSDAKSPGRGRSKRPPSAKTNSRNNKSATSTMTAAEPLPPFAPSSSSSAADLSECTFTPQVNRVPSRMRVAQEYVQQNAFERLAAAAATSKASNAAPDRSRSASPASSSTSLESFLTRQYHYSAQRQSRLKQIRTGMEAEVQFHKPAINPKSLAIVETKGMGNFLERLNEKSSPKKALVVAQSSVPQEQPTFKPAINEYSRQLPAKSPEELSGAELRARQARAEQAQNAALRVELEQLTGAPLTLSRVNPQSPYAAVPSVLQLSSPHGASTLIERISVSEALRDAQRHQWSQLREALELSKCTFQPETKDVPKFIQMQNQEYKQKKLSQTDRVSPRKTAKPDWK